MTHRGRLKRATAPPAHTPTRPLAHRRRHSAYAGMPYFDPYEIFQQQTTTTLMALLLIHDVMNPKGVARTAASDLQHPLSIFAKNQVVCTRWFARGGLRARRRRGVCCAPLLCAAATDLRTFRARSLR